MAGLSAISRAAHATNNASSSSGLLPLLMNATGVTVHGSFPFSGHNPLLSESISPEIVASWPPPNFVNPETKHTQLFAWELVLLGLAVSAVLLRLYVRIWMMSPLWKAGWDDWGVAVALLFAIGLTTVELNATRYGYGMHIWDVRPHWIIPMRQMTFCSEIFFILSTSTLKLSILYFYLRLSVSPTFRRLVHFGMFFVIATGVSFLFVVIFQCHPIRAYWDLTLPEARCIDEYAAHIANAVLNSLSDLYVFLLPIKDMLRLQLPLRQRISLAVLFSLGGLVCIAGWLRVWQLTSVLNRTYDNTWVGPTMYILTAVECDVAIICGCLPALKPLMAKVIPGLRRFSFRRLSGAGLSDGGDNERKSSGGEKGNDPDAKRSDGNRGNEVVRGAVSAENTGQCPCSDPTKLVDPAGLMTARPAGRWKLGARQASWQSDSSIPLYGDIVKSTNRLSSTPPNEAGVGGKNRDLEKGVIVETNALSK